jgi:hypothetical protein
MSDLMSGVPGSRAHGAWSARTFNTHKRKWGGAEYNPFVALVSGELNENTSELIRWAQYSNQLYGHSVTHIANTCRQQGEPLMHALPFQPHAQSQEQPRTGGITLSHAAARSRVT